MSNKLLKLTWGLKPCGSPSQRLLLAALADHADESGRCFPSIALLQAETELSKNTVIRSLRALAGRGWIEIQRKAVRVRVGPLRRNNAYTLNRSRLEAEQLTGSTMPPVEDSTGATMAPVQVPPWHHIGATMAPVIEPPLTPIRTPIKNTPPLRVVPRKIGKREPREVPAFVLAEFIPPDTWEDFEQHRIRIGKPLDDGKRWTTQKRLQRFHGEGQDVREILETSIIGGWQGVFRGTTKQSHYAAAGVTNPVQAIDQLRGVS